MQKHLVSSRFKYKLLLAVFIFSNVPTYLAFAAHDKQFYSTNDVIYHDPDATDCGVASGTSAAVVVDTNENTQTLLKFFTGKGLSLAAAAGIAGNIHAESSFNPAKIEGGAIAPDNIDITSLIFTSGPRKGQQEGFGLAQWTSLGRKKNLVSFAASKNTKITDMTMQLEFMWQEMNSAAYKTVVSGLDAEKTDPVAAAILFHKIYEGSADTAAQVLKNRGGYAKAVFQKYDGTILDGTGVTGVDTTSGSATDGSSVACTDPTSSGDVGVGTGNFVDTGQVTAWASVLANAKASEAAYGKSLVGNGYCATIVARVWKGVRGAYGYNYATDLWNENKSKFGHTDRSPKKGAILIYKTSNVAGHVVIYLGGNKVLNDGHIENADYIEKVWGGTYLGWVDPTDLGWQSKVSTDIKAAVGF